MVLLIEAGPRLLAAFPPRLSAKAARSLEHLGVTPLLGHAVTGLDETGVVVRDGERERRIAARTIIWAAGVLASEIAGELAEAAGAQTDRAGRIVVEPNLWVSGHADVIAIGDMVAVRGKPSFPGLAPVAMQMGARGSPRAGAAAGPAGGGLRLPRQGQPGDDPAGAGGRRHPRSPR